MDIYSKWAPDVATSSLIACKYQVVNAGYRWALARGKQTMVLLSPALSCGKIFLHLNQHLGLVCLVHLTSEVTQKEPAQRL